MTPNPKRVMKLGRNSTFLRFTSRKSGKKFQAFWFTEVWSGYGSKKTTCCLNTLYIYTYISQHGSQVSVLKSNNQVGGVEKQLAAEGESWYSSRSWDAAQPRPRQAAESMRALAPQHLGFKRLFWCLDCRCTSGKKLWLGCKIHKLRTPTSYSH